MKTKTKTVEQQRRKGAKKKERACIRCGCTEDRACPGNCSWVGDSDVCTRCLSPEEAALHNLLVWRWKHAHSVDKTEKQLRLLGEMITLVKIDDIPF